MENGDSQGGEALEIPLPAQANINLMETQAELGTAPVNGFEPQAVTTLKSCLKNSSNVHLNSILPVSDQPEVDKVPSDSPLEHDFTLASARHVQSMHTKASMFRDDDEFLCDVSDLRIETWDHGGQYIAIDFVHLKKNIKWTVKRREEQVKKLHEGLLRELSYEADSLPRPPTQRNRRLFFNHKAEVETERSDDSQGSRVSDDVNKEKSFKSAPSGFLPGPRNAMRNSLQLVADIMGQDDGDSSQALQDRAKFCLGLLTYFRRLCRKLEVLESEAFGVFAEVSSRSFLDTENNETKLPEGYIGVRGEEGTSNSVIFSKLSFLGRTMQIIWNFTVGMGFRQPKRRSWLCLRKNSLYLVPVREVGKVQERILFEPELRVLSGASQTGFIHGIVMTNSVKSLILQAETHHEMKVWLDCIQKAYTESDFFHRHRFDSFAPPRPMCYARPIVDGQEHFDQILSAIQLAQEEILICDWWLSPNVHLARGDRGPAQLGEELRLRAEAGVRIFVVVYREFEVALPNNSAFTRKALMDKHPNIIVLRHPRRGVGETAVIYWSHHSKICVVDHKLAFVGGIDLCFGRWDTTGHPMTDFKEPYLFPGKHYSNPSYQDFKDVHEMEGDLLDRRTIPRMPRHDVSVMFIGPAALDVERHFYTLWHHVFTDLMPRLDSVYNDKDVLACKESDIATVMRPTAMGPVTTSEGKTAKGAQLKRTATSVNMVQRLKSRGNAYAPHPGLQLPNHLSTESFWEYSHSDQVARNFDGKECTIQVLRSASKWSLGLPQTEHSIQNAYVKLIEEAEDFVYIENQFWVSSTEKGCEETKQLAFELAEVNFAYDKEMQRLARDLPKEFFDQWWKTTKFWITLTGKLGIILMVALTIHDFFRNSDFDVFIWRTSMRWIVVLLFAIFIFLAHKKQPRAIILRGVLCVLICLHFAVIILSGEERLVLLRGDRVSDRFACWSPLSFVLPQLVWVVAVFRLLFFDTLIILVTTAAMHIATSLFLEVDLWSSHAGVISDMFCLLLGFGTIAWASYRDDQQARFFHARDYAKDQAIANDPVMKASPSAIIEGDEEFETVANYKSITGFVSELVDGALLVPEVRRLHELLKQRTIKRTRWSIWFTDPEVEFAFRRGEWASIQRWAQITMTAVAFGLGMLSLWDVKGDRQIPEQIQICRLYLRLAILMAFALHMFLTRATFRVRISYKRKSLLVTIMMYLTCLIFSDAERLIPVLSEDWREPECFAYLAILMVQIGWVCVAMRLHTRQALVLVLFFFLTYSVTGAILGVRELEDKQVALLSLFSLALLVVVFVCLARRFEILTRIHFLLEVEERRERQRKASVVVKDHSNASSRSMGVLTSFRGMRGSVINELRRKGSVSQGASQRHISPSQRAMTSRGISFMKGNGTGSRSSTFSIQGAHQDGSGSRSSTFSAQRVSVRNLIPSTFLPKNRNSQRTSTAHEGTVIGGSCPPPSRESTKSLDGTASGTGSRSSGMYSASHQSTQETLAEDEEREEDERGGVDSCWDDSETNFVDNCIARTLIDRIVTAKKKRRRFRAYIVLPVMPATEAAEATDLRAAGGYSSRQQILLNALSVSQGARSFLETLERELTLIQNLTVGMPPPQARPATGSGNCPDSAMAQWPLSSEFVSFCSLRQYCTMPDGRPMSEQIYVHSKVMIADDRRVVIGSANINDRSLLGDRDSEFSVFIEQSEAVCNSKDNFARSLRMFLWREHFNLLEEQQHCCAQGPPSRPSKVKTTKAEAVLQRPESDACWQLWTRTAAQNTVWFRKELGVWPDTTQRTWSQLDTAQKDVQEGKSPVKASSSQPLGRLVEYPFHFLVDEDLSKPTPAIVPPTRIFA